MKAHAKFLSIFSFSLATTGNALAQGWFVRSSFLPAQTLQTIRFYDTNTGYTASSLYNGSTFNIYRTTDGGNTWTAQNSGYTSMRFMSIYIFHPDTVLISGNNGIIEKTTNGGSTWGSIPTGVTDQLWSLEFTSRTIGYCAGSSGRILKTTDGGDSWFALSSNVQNQLYCLKFLNDSLGYVSGSGILLRTSDRGNSWVDMHFPSIPPFDELRQLVFTDPATAYVIADLGRIRKTTDAGATWTMLNTGTTEALFGIDFVDQNTAYSCGYNGTIIRTTNAGQTWAPQTSGLTEILYGVDFTAPDTGYICTWSGKILKTTNGGVTFVPYQGEVTPERFQLNQNYPNPFNPGTTISFIIPHSSFVDVTVYDVLGREVITLVNEEKAPGRYQVPWDARDLAGGVYFLRLSLRTAVGHEGAIVQTRKMLLIR